MTIRFEPLAQRHIHDAAMLALTAFANERQHVPALAADGVPETLRRAIADLIRVGTGVAAVDGDRLMGYLAFRGPIEGFWGSIGASSPLHGSAVAGSNRGRLITRLFQHGAAAMTARGVDTFAITTYRHDREIAEALTLTGFGIRLADAIRMIEPPLDIAPVPGIEFREVRWQDAGPLLPLFNGLVRHLRSTPSFVGIDNEFSEQQFAGLLKRRESRFFVAFDGNEPIGYVEVGGGGENVLTTAPDMVNICGAYLSGDYRGRGIYDALLAFTLATLRAEDVRRVGVDFETMNPTALHFWSKYFDRYTSTFARRIDALS